MTKTNLVRWGAPAGAIHSLPHLETLSADPCLLVCLSERSLYLMQNLAAVELQFPARYARVLTEDGFWPVRSGDPEYELYRDATERLKEELIDMSCNIQTGLEDVGDGLRSIATALGQISLGGGGCGFQLANPIANCLDIDNETLTGPPGQQQGDPGVDPPPDGFATWEEYFIYKCQAAHFIWTLERAHMVALRNFEGIALVATIVTPVIAGLSGVLPLAFTPAGFVLFVASVVAIGVVAGWSWFYLDEMIGWWDDNKDDIICSLYTSGTSVQAVSALANALEDAIQAIAIWGYLAPVSGQISGLLGDAFAQLAGNGIVEPLFKATAAVLSVGGYDCEGCEGIEGYAFDTWGRNGGSASVGHCMHLAEGGSYNRMKGREDGIVSAFVYNRQGYPCNARDFRFWICLDFGRSYSGGERRVYARARRIPGSSLYNVFPVCRYARSQEEWDGHKIDGRWDEMWQAGGYIENWLNYPATLEWRLMYTLPANHAPADARWLCFCSDVPYPDGWSEGATWEADAFRIEVD